MEINIKKNGNAKGTVGWLAKGLESGELRLEEGTQKDNGYHGLWLKGEGVSVFLAGYNQYGLSIAEYEKANKYELADEHFSPRQYSDACWESLRGIAAQWVEECNDLMDSETAASIKIKRVEV